MKAAYRETYEWVEATAATETDECILWPFYQMKQGYGMVRRCGRSRLVSHLILELSGHPRPPAPANHALHSCPGGGTPACCNPRHLRWGTNAENIADRMAVGHSSGARGERVRTAKITADDVRAIRLRRANGETHLAIAQDYGMTSQNVGDICRHKLWRHVS